MGGEGAGLSPLLSIQRSRARTYGRGRPGRALQPMLASSRPARAALLAGVALCVVVALLTPARARADAPAATQLSAVRSWSSPTSTRIVLDFTRPVTPVVPDSGFTRELVLSVPGPGMSIAGSVPSLLRVRD